MNGLNCFIPMSTDWLIPYAALQPQCQDAVLTLELPPAWARVESMEQFAALLDTLASHPDIRVLVLTLKGPAHGALDPEHWQQVMARESTRAHQALQLLHRWRTLTLKTLPQAVLVRVSGHCTGASLALLEGSDVALAHQDTVFELQASQLSWLSASGEAAFADADSPWHDTPMHPLKVQRLSAAQAQTRGWITFALNDAELDVQAQELISSWLDKDRLALQFTKETLAHVGRMGWDASVSYTAAKFAEIKARQAELGSSSRANAIAGFLSGQSKPGLQG